MYSSCSCMLNVGVNSKSLPADTDDSDINWVVDLLVDEWKKLQQNMSGDQFLFRQEDAALNVMNKANDFFQRKRRLTDDFKSKGDAQSTSFENDPASPKHSPKHSPI